MFSTERRFVLKQQHTEKKHLPFQHFKKLLVDVVRFTKGEPSGFADKALKIPAEKEMFAFQIVIEKTC